MVRKLALFVVAKKWLLNGTKNQQKEEKKIKNLTSLSNKYMNQATNLYTKDSYIMQKQRMP